ncbi:TPA: hypothetical protein JBI81_10450 [Legionella pneumophila]|nr:hypothetical protein [Legionella pneumophila]HCX3262987.1 TIGR04141 family sporadically distributed protein [Legionella pneumophila]HDI4841701.1 TIGR04141 family sporadically distributed protein [Legionella pneumophila]
MPTKYNIYKVIPNKKDELISKLSFVGLEKIGSKSYENWQMDFYFSSQPDSVDIWWTDIYSDFFGEEEKPKNQIYFAVLLVHKQHICYAISLGKSHFYLKNFCDLDFGLNLAERIVDPNNIRIKNSKFYKSKKNKVVTTYQEGSDMDLDSGESTHYLKAITINKEIWGKTASFGHSVLLNVNLKPDELPSLIESIEKKLTQERLLSIPRVIKIDDEKEIKRLDDLLADKIIQQGEASLQENSISLSGIDFIFSDQFEYSLYTKGESNNKSEKGDITLSALINFVKSNNIDLKKDLNNIKVKIHNEYGRDRTVSLKELLDFIDEEKRCCLLDGSWYQFNQSYIEFVNKEIDTIDLECDEQEVTALNEEEFNKSKAAQGFINCDKVFRQIDKKYKVEHMDLYKDETLYFVKFGKPQKLNYAIDQANNTIKLLQNNQPEIKVDDQIIKPKTMCLWFVLDRKSKLDKLSQINSLIFHMKLLEWKRLTRNAGYTPKIIISYKSCDD